MFKKTDTNIKEVKNFKRMNLFKHYHEANIPFIILTTKIDVTKVLEVCKGKNSFYATFGFFITETANKIDAFKYRYENGKIYYCEELCSNYTQMLEDETIGFFDVPRTEKYDEYINDFKRIQNDFINSNDFSFENKLNEIWLSCAPWISFTSLIPPINKEVTIPQFIWDKYECVDGKYYVNLMIMVHHGFADGFHVGKFINLLNENIESFTGE